MGNRSEKLSQGGSAGRHSPDSSTINSGSGGSVGGQHSPKDPQGAKDKGLNSSSRAGQPTSHGDSKKGT